MYDLAYVSVFRFNLLLSEKRRDPINFTGHKKLKLLKLNKFKLKFVLNLLKILLCNTSNAVNKVVQILYSKKLEFGEIPNFSRQINTHDIVLSHKNTVMCVFSITSMCFIVP